MNNLFASHLVYTFFQEINKKEIQYAVLRNYEGLPDVNDSKDVDIVVAPDILHKVVSILYDVADRLNYQLIWKNSLDYLDGFVFVKIEDNHIYSIKLDIFNGFKWRGCSYIDHQFVLDSTKEYNGFKVPLKSHEAFIMIVYYLLYAKQIREKYLEPIYTNAINDLKNLEIIIKLTFQEDLAHNVIDMIQKKQVSNLISLRNQVRNHTIKNNLKSFTYLFQLIKHIKTEYYDRNSLGTLIVDISEEKGFLDELINIFYSLGISNDTKPYYIETSNEISKFEKKIKRDLHSNQIVFVKLKLIDSVVVNQTIKKDIENMFESIRKPDYIRVDKTDDYHEIFKKLEVKNK